MTLLRVVVLAMVVTAAGCASSAPAAVESIDGTYVGTVQGSDAWIAVVIRGNDAAVYACGGSSSFTTVSRGSNSYTYCNSFWTSREPGKTYSNVFTTFVPVAH